MAPRANWKGFLKIGDLTCPIALYTAASTTDRITLNTINRETGNRVSRHYVDSDTGDIVDKDNQVKGYETSPGEYVLIEQEELSALVPESDKMLSVDAFIALKDVDDVFFGKPYYLAPSDKTGQEAFALIRDGMKSSKVAALAQTVLFRKLRTVLIRAVDKGLVAHTLHFDYEVRASDQVFEDVPELKIKGEMLKLAEHIISTKMGAFDPAAFDDRYEDALAELMKAKQEGRKIEIHKPEKQDKVIDLMAALRESAKAAKASKKSAKSKAPTRRQPQRRQKAS